MKKFYILHLSDIHCGINFVIKQKDAYGYSKMSAEEYLAKKIVYDLSDRLNVSPDYIVISGDLTEGGQKREFIAAKKFIDHLLGGLRHNSIHNISKDNIIIVPGNHDINISDNKRAYRTSRGKVKAAYECKEKYSKFYEFFDEFYTASRHERTFNHEKGFHLFKYPENCLAFIGYNSCNKISYARLKAPGWIYPDQINYSIEQLGDEKKFPIRIAVLHHNPKNIPLFKEEIQMDLLASIQDNGILFDKYGIGLLLHGHRHVNATSCIKDHERDDSYELLSVGAGTIGSSSYEGSGSGNRYQIIEFTCKQEIWEIKVIPRFLDLVSGAVNEIGRGHFVHDSTVGHNSIAVKAPQLYKENIDECIHKSTGKKRISKTTSPAKKKGKAEIEEPKTKELHKKKSDKKKIISNEDPVITLERIQAMRIFGSYDNARNEVAKLSNQAKHNTDKQFLNFLLNDITILEDQDKQVLSSDDKRELWQKHYNKLSSKTFKQNFGKGIFPQWVLESEITRLDFQLAILTNRFWKDFKNNMAKHINKVSNIFLESDKSSFMSYYRRMALLLDLNELSHARQCLNEAFAIGPGYAPFYYLASFLAIKELRYNEALSYLKKAKNLVTKEIGTHAIDFMISYCYYFLGEFEKAIALAEQGMTNWPDDVGFRNNYAFARTRQVLSDVRGNVWESPELATAILDDFLMSIMRIGSFDVAHFNYALLLYWAYQHGDLPTAKAILQNYGRANMVSLPDKSLVTEAFTRAKNVYLKSHDHFHAAICTYFIERTKQINVGTTKEIILDHLLWDADNFFSFRHKKANWKRSLLRRSKLIRSPLDFSHIATLKRWNRDIQPLEYGNIKDGGGYFIKWYDHGIVLNPGANFLNHFYRRGYALTDIDLVMVTSSKYVDFEELMGLLELLDQASKYRAKESMVEVYMERRIFNKFPNIHLKSPNTFLDPTVLPTRNTAVLNGDVEIQSIIPCHNCEYFRNSGGFSGEIQYPSVIAKILLKKSGYPKCRIGILSDFCRPQNILRFLDDLDIILVSVGPLTPYSLFKNNIPEPLDSDIKQLFNDDPLYKESYGELRKLGNEINNDEKSSNFSSPLHCINSEYVGIEGLLEISKYLEKKKKIVILSDLSNELGDKRHKLATAINDKYPEGTRYITEDVGLVIGIPDKQVLCEYDYEMVSINEIDEECREGELLGPVKHFCAKHRKEVRFREFLARDY